MALSCTVLHLYKMGVIEVYIVTVSVKPNFSEKLAQATKTSSVVLVTGGHIGVYSYMHVSKLQL